MRMLRNWVIFVGICTVVAGCGGGNTTISSNNYTDSQNTAATTSTTTVPNTPSSGTTTGSLTLKWTAPTTRADNTTVSLSEISGYRLYYGPTATNTPNFVAINDGSATQYTISLPSGSYYFRVSAIDSSGNEGLKSTALQKTL